MSGRFHYLHFSREPLQLSAVAVFFFFTPSAPRGTPSEWWVFRLGWVCGGGQLCCCGFVLVRCAVGKSELCRVAVVSRAVRSDFRGREQARHCSRVASRPASPRQPSKEKKNIFNTSAIIIQHFSSLSLIIIQNLSSFV